MSIRQYLQSSLGRKWLMAMTGLILVLFVMGHMLGNLLIFLGPDAINAYAYKLHSIPDAIMTLIRLSLLLAVGIHIWMAVLLTLENKKAKPQGFKNKVKSTYASRTMRMSGVILLSFIIFHILHYTVRIFVECYIIGISRNLSKNDIIVIFHGRDNPHRIV